MLDPIALAQLHLDVLYETDADGRLLRSRGAGVPAPSYHLVRTLDGNRWLISAAYPQWHRDALARSLAARPSIDSFDVLERPQRRVAWVTRSRAGAVRRDHAGPAFIFPETLVEPGPPVELISNPAHVETDPELAWLREVTPQEHPLCVARDDEGRIVSVCHSSRSTPLAAEAGVETARTYRGLGLACAVVAGWAAAVRAEGRVPMYSTGRSNHASRGVARKLGLMVYGEDFHSFRGPNLRVRLRG